MNKDIIYNILSLLDDEDLLNFCLTNREICNIPQFWKDKINLLPKFLLDKNIDYKRAYLSYIKMQKLDKIDYDIDISHIDKNFIITMLEKLGYKLTDDKITFKSLRKIAYREGISYIKNNNLYFIEDLDLDDYYSILFNLIYDHYITLYKIL